MSMKNTIKIKMMVDDYLKREMKFDTNSVNRVFHKIKL